MTEREITIYAGSLDELNSRDPSKQYKFAATLDYNQEYSSPCKKINRESLDILIDNVKEGLRKEGFEGLVNKTVSIVLSEDKAMFHFIVQGTPIVRKDDD